MDRSSKDPFSLNKLLEADILRLLCCPLVQDVSPTIQVVGLDALAKLTAAAPSVASAVTDTGAVSYAVLGLQHDSRIVQRSSNNAIQAVASSSLAGKSLACIYMRVYRYLVHALEKPPIYLAYISRVCSRERWLSLSFSPPPQRAPPPPSPFSPPPGAQSVMDAGGLAPLRQQLEDLDLTVRGGSTTVGE